MSGIFTTIMIMEMKVLTAVTLLLRLQVGVMAWLLLLLSSKYATFFLVIYENENVPLQKWTNHNVDCCVLVFAAVSKMG